MIGWSWSWLIDMVCLSLYILSNYVWNCKAHEQNMCILLLKFKTWLLNRFPLGGQGNEEIPVNATR